MLCESSKCMTVLQILVSPLNTPTEGQENAPINRQPLAGLHPQSTSGESDRYILVCPLSTLMLPVQLGHYNALVKNKALDVPIRTHPAQPSADGIFYSHSIGTKFFMLSTKCALYQNSVTFLRAVLDLFIPGSQMSCSIETKDLSFSFYPLL